MNRRTCDKVIHVCDKVVFPLGLRCIDVQWQASENTLVIYIEVADFTSPSSEAGDRITFAECKKVTRSLQELTEFDELVPDDVRLEVSSPGVEPPIRKKEDFARFCGQKVRMLIEVLDGDEPHEAFEGCLIDVDDEGPLLSLANAGTEIRVPFGEIISCHLAFDWNQT